MSRLLSESESRPNALTAFRLARRWFKAGQRIEMQELAAQLGVNRATLFRWVGSRDDLLAEVVWSLGKPTLDAAVKETSGQGGARIAAVLGRFATLMDQSEYFRAFLQREPERALRVLTTGASPVRGRAVAAVEAMLREELDRGQLGSPLPPHDMAYLLVRIIETFLYTDMITGETPDPARVEQATAALLSS